MTEMLAKFTEVEKLDGHIYACDQCNRKYDNCCIFDVSGMNVMDCMIS